MKCKGNRRIAVLAVMALGLAGCGGGGGGGGGGGNNGAAFSLSTTSISFNAASETRPQSQTITGTVTGEPSGTLYVVVTPANPLVATVSNVAINGAAGTASIIAGVPTDLGGGNHTTTISVRACVNDPSCNTNQLRGSPQTITVNYAIAGVATSVPPPSGLHFQVDNVRGTGAITQTFNVTGSPNLTWTLSADVPWLMLTPTSGNTNSSVTVTATVPEAHIDRLRAGTFTSLITATPSSGVPARVQVTLHLDQSVVTNVAPYLDTASSAGDVIVRGANLTGATGVSFGGVPASQFSVVNGTQINATHPALPAGTYPVTIATSPGAARTYATLKIVEPTTYAPAELPYSIVGTVSVNQVVYDAERRAVLVSLVDFAPAVTAGWIYRFEHHGGAWSGPVQAPLPVWHSMAMAGDGESLIVSYPEPPADVTVAEWDPRTLTELRKTTRGNAVDPDSAKGALSMAVASDGTAVIATGSRCCSGLFPVIAYSPLSQIPLMDIFDANFLGASSGIVSGSADGGTVLVTDTTDQLFGYPVYRFSSNGLPRLVRANLAPLPQHTIAINRNGSRIVLGTRPLVYDANLSVTGALPFELANVSLAPLSARAYTYDASANTVRVADLAASANGVYLELAPITLAGDPGSHAKIAVSPDERTLFIAGDAALVVQPL